MDYPGRPVRMTKENWSWVWDTIYSPFGATAYTWTNGQGSDARLPGQWLQLESGLAYNWNRHYDATTGRYVQPDPLGLPAVLSDGPNVYGYVNGNPFGYVYPEGLAGSFIGIGPQGPYTSRYQDKMELCVDAPSDLLDSPTSMNMWKINPYHILDTLWDKGI